MVKAALEILQGPMETCKPLKVLVLTSCYPRNQEDLAGIFLRYMAEGLVRRGVAVHILAPAFQRGGSSVEGGVLVHRFRYLPSRLQKLAYGSGILSNLKRSPWLWLEVPFFIIMMSCCLLRLLWRERPNLIHAHWVLPQGLVAVWAKLFYTAPVITTAHGSDVFALRGRLFDVLRRFVLRRSDAWTSNSHATADAVGEQPSLPRPHILPMGVDVQRFQSGLRAKLRQGLPDDECVLLFIGRLVEQKGLANLLQALSLLPSTLRDRTSLWVVGDGQDRVRLEQYAQRLGIDAKVHFWGHVGNDLLPDFYAAADLFVAPSGSAEGQGIVISEAFAARLCVLATRVGGIREVVEDHYTGILVEPRNPQKLASALEALLGNPKLRKELANNAFARVKKHYDWEEITNQFEELYRAVLNHRSL